MKWLIIAGLLPALCLVSDCSAVAGHATSKPTKASAVAGNIAPAGVTVPDPANASASFTVSPAGATVKDASFVYVNAATKPPTAVLTKLSNLSGTFSVPFNQNLLGPTSKLKIYFGSNWTSISVERSDNAVSSSGPAGVSEPFDEGDVFGYLSLPVTHSFSQWYSEYTYTIAVTPESLTIWSTPICSASIDDSAAEGIDYLETDMVHYAENHSYTGDRVGTTAAVGMTLEANPAIPMITPHFQAATLSVSDYFASGQNLQANFDIGGLDVKGDLGVIPGWTGGVGSVSMP